LLAEKVELKEKISKHTAAEGSDVMLWFFSERKYLAASLDVH
jgi:hypothetical protein